MFDAAEAYDRFMGRYSTPLAPQFASFAGVQAGQRVLDVGCGPGALTTEIVKRVGVQGTVAVDPSAPFVAAAASRHPGVEVRIASAEKLPFDDDSFDAVLAQLVVHFMADPVEGLGEMRRVTRTDGIAAACVWDHGGGGGPLALFWQAARAVDRDVDDESERPGTHEGQLADLFAAAGFDQIERA
ncbi:MAG: class I SAM-dependent methyltransferase, partial [Mycobacteriales bacterium]